MPFQNGNQIGKHGNHRKGHECYNRDQLTRSKWMQKDGVTKRILPEEFEQYLADGWSLGRPATSEETRRKQIESAKKSINPAHWKPGHPSWNLGKKMDDTVRLGISFRQLSKYGITREQIANAWASGMRWCSEHLAFEPLTAFAVLQGSKQSTRCKMSHKKHSSWFKEQLEKQNGVCALCGCHPDNGRALCVDHDHDCDNPRHTRKHDAVLGCECSRGLLCHNCNIRIEELENFISQGSGFTPHPGTWAERALAYLKSYEKPLTEYV